MEATREAKKDQDRCRAMAKRVTEALGAAYRSLVFAWLPQTYTIPSLAEVVFATELLPPQFFQNNTSPTAVEEALPSTTTVPVGSPMLQEYALRWKEDMVESLLDLVRQSSTYVDRPRQSVTADILSYASTIFSCVRCQEHFSYPDLFSHACFWETWRCAMTQKRKPSVKSRSKGTSMNLGHSGIDDSDNLAGCKELYIREAFGDTNLWRPRNLLQFNEAAHHHARSMLTSLGMDADSTVEALAALNPYVEGLCQCFRPSTGKGTANNTTGLRTATRWTTAVSIDSFVVKTWIWRKERTLKNCLQMKKCRRHRSCEYEGSFRVFQEGDLQGLSGFKIHTYPLYIPAGGRYREYCPWCREVPQSLFYHLMER